MFDLQSRNNVARLTLNRPEARNAIPASDWAALGKAFAEVTRSGARILLIMGAGGAFCAGADLSDFAEMDEAAAANFRRDMRGALDRLRDLAIPTVAAIEGPCFGAGVALAMACDIRLAGQGARFAITPAKLGISYPQDDVQHLVSLVGPGQASRILFGAVAMDGAEAERIGLIECYAGDGLSAAIDALVASILANSPESIAALKRGVRLASEGVASDQEQDRRFDALLGSGELALRLQQSRKAK